METENTVNDDTVNDCPILYSEMKYWETSEGWNDIVADLSYALEELNIRYYDRYGIKIVAEQIKQKFGGFRFYYRIVKDIPYGFRWFRDFLGFLIDRLDRINYGAVYVTDIPTHTKTYLSKNKINQSYKDTIKDINDNGDIYISEVTVFMKKHVEYTKHRFIHMIKTALEKISTFYETHLIFDTRKSNVIIRALDEKVNRMIAETEKRCEKTCEECGHEMYDDKDVCYTRGWIRTMCEHCMKENHSNQEYYKGKNLYKNGVLIKEHKEEN